MEPLTIFSLWALAVAGICAVWFVGGLVFILGGAFATSWAMTKMPERYHKWCTRLGALFLIGVVDITAISALVAVTVIAARAAL